MTAITVIGICGFAAARGWSIVHFSLTTMDIVSSENREEAVRAWRTVPGVATAAWQAELTGKINPPDLKAANSRRDGLAAILSIKPRESVTVPRVAASVALLVGVHALVDFSLQIQAVAITFMTVLGAGVAQSESPPLTPREYAPS